MIDTHAHLDDELYGNPHAMISNFVSDGLEIVITVGCDYQSAFNAVKLAEKYENVYAIIGFHPDYVDNYNEEIFEMLNNPKVVGVGEIGLDYHARKDNKEEQKKMFVRQLEIAFQYGLPIEIHSRDAVGDTLAVLKENKHLLKYGGIWHCFNESYEVFKEAKKLGLKVAFGGVTTFKNAHLSQELIKNIDLNDVVFETDCPYLTPEPMRGRAINEPKYVRFTAQHFADLKEMHIDKVIEATNKNVYDVFKKLRKQ